jgi:hypothetical protein
VSDTGAGPIELQSCCKSPNCPISSDAMTAMWLSSGACLCRPRWAAIRSNASISLHSVGFDVLEKMPMSDAALFSAGLGRHADAMSVAVQTGDANESQDTQTMPIMVRPST